MKSILWFGLMLDFVFMVKCVLHSSVCETLEEEGLKRKENNNNRSTLLHLWRIYESYETDNRSWMVILSHL